MKRISFDRIDTSVAYLKDYEISNDRLIIPYNNVIFPSYMSFPDDPENEVIDYCHVVCVDVVVVRHNGKEIYLSENPFEGMIKLVRLTGTHTDTGQKEEFLVFCRRCYLELEDESDHEEGLGLINSDYLIDL